MGINGQGHMGMVQEVSIGSKPQKLEYFQPMRLGYTMCMEMFGSGVWITGMKPTKAHQLMEACGCLQIQIKEFCGEGLGSFSLISAAQLFATGVFQRLGLTEQAFELRANYSGIWVTASGAHAVSDTSVSADFVSYSGSAFNEGEMLT